MILTCNACSKKFVVPDSAITSSGRMVQCGSCGNKWRQFPTGEIKTNQPIAPSPKIISKAWLGFRYGRLFCVKAFMKIHVHDKEVTRCAYKHILSPKQE